MTLCINGTQYDYIQHNSINTTLSITTLKILCQDGVVVEPCAKSHYAECRSAGSRGTLVARTQCHTAFYGDKMQMFVVS